MVKGTGLVKNGIKSISVEAVQKEVKEKLLVLPELTSTCGYSKFNTKLDRRRKGITFWQFPGHFCPKSSNNMHLTKSDMGGAAAVIGSIEAASEDCLCLVHLIAGNLCSWKRHWSRAAYKPRCNRKLRSGKSTRNHWIQMRRGRYGIGRWAISIWSKLSTARMVVDPASLISAVGVATGPYPAGMLHQKCDELARTFYQAGCPTGEPGASEITLWDDYKT